MNVLIVEEDGEYIGTMENFWFVEEGENEKEVIYKLAESLKEFAVDYNKDLELYKTTSDFNIMLPFLQEVIKSDINSIIDTFYIKRN